MNACYQTIFIILQNTLHFLNEIINNKARHNLIDSKCRWRSDRLDGAVSFWEPLGQTKVMQIRQRETQNHQGPAGAITHEVCCLAAQCFDKVHILFCKDFDSMLCYVHP